MNKTKIEWVRNPDGNQGFTNNPIKGLCPVECKLPDGKIYCYGRPIYKRFHSDVKKPYLSNVALRKVGWRRKPAGIFVCSTFELFHPITNTEIAKNYTWRDQIFDVIANSPQHRFYILTKFPQNINQSMPDNVWLGCSITGDDNQWDKGFNLFMAKAKLKFISFEPLFAPIEILDELYNFDWIIVGALTGHGNKYQPEKAWIKKIVDECKIEEVPIFLKDNLIPIMGKEYVMKFREFPGKEHK